MRVNIRNRVIRFRNRVIKPRKGGSFMAAGLRGSSFRASGSDLSNRMSRLRISKPHYINF